MSIRVVDVTDLQRDKLLQLVEGHFADGKRRAIGPAKLSKTVSAFANADGGELFVGLAEQPDATFTWDGFDDPEDANGHIQVFEQLFPLGRDFTYTFLGHHAEKGLILHVVVQKSRAVVRASDKMPYLRRGAQNLPVDTTEKLNLLERNKGLTSFENEPVNAPLAEVANSEVILGFMLDVVPSAEPEAWLRKQQLIVADKPSVAGVVLFADLPQALIPKRCGIKLYRYKTSKSEGQRDTLAGLPETVEGCAYDAIKRAVEQTEQMISELPVLGESGLVKVQYPTETLHEVITNAVLHRDYSVADDVHIRVFDNRVEVESPGRLPAHITIKNIRRERFSRNGNLVRVINKFPDPPNKDVGEGLNTAFEAMRKLKLKEPVIEERDNSVLVQIRHERLASYDVMILEYLESHETIKNKEARDLCFVDADYKMRRVFSRLEKRGLIQKVPGTLQALTAYCRGSSFATWRTTLVEESIDEPADEDDGAPGNDPPSQ